jgi:hypothetical protein
MPGVAIVSCRLLIEGELSKELKLLPALIKIDEAILYVNINERRH